MLRRVIALAVLVASPAVASPATPWFTGQAGETRVVWNTSDLAVSYGVNVTFSAREDFDTRSGGADGECWAEGKYRLLSLVGQAVSYEYAYGSFCGQAHPAGETRFVTLDAQTGHPMPLTTWFAEGDILAALAKDPYVKKCLGTKPPTSLDRWIDDMAGDDAHPGLPLRPETLESYAFHHVEGDRVAVRLDLVAADEANRNEVTELSLLLPIPPAHAAALKAAASGQGGLLLSHGTQAATSFLAGHPKFKIITRF